MMISTVKKITAIFLFPTLVNLQISDIYYSKQTNKNYQANSIQQNQKSINKLAVSSAFNSKEDNLKIFGKLMFEIYYPQLGEVKSVTILEGGGSLIKPILIKTKQNKGYVLKPVNQYSPNILPNFFEPIWRQQNPQYYIDFTNHLKENGIPVATFSKQKNGEYFFETNGMSYSIMNYIEEGKSIGFGKNLDSDKLHDKNLGIMAGEINNAQEDFTTEYNQDPALGDAYKIRQIQNLIEEYSQGISQNKYTAKELPIIQKKLEQCRLFLTNYPKLNKTLFKKAHIHSDLFGMNVKYDENGKVIGIFDFDFSHYDYRIAEFLNLVKCYTYKGKIKNFILAYQSSAKTPLNEEEIKGIIELIRFRHITGNKPYYDRDIFSFAEDFSDEQTIQNFVDETFKDSGKTNKILNKKFSSIKGLKKYCDFYLAEHQNLNNQSEIPSFFNCFNRAVENQKLESEHQQIAVIKQEIENWINPNDYKTSDDFLARVKFIYPEYRNSNPSSRDRREHTDLVIKMYHAFVTENFQEIYDYLPDTKKTEISFKKYVEFLKIAKAKYDSLSPEFKKILQEATIFHDYGYEYAKKVNDHGYEGAWRVTDKILKDLRNPDYLKYIHFIILKHGDYGDIGVVALPNDILELDQTHQDLLFLVGLFDTAGKLQKNGANNMTKEMTEHFTELVNKLKKQKAENNFYESRFDNLLSPKNIVAPIPEALKLNLKNKIEELIPVDKKNDFHAVWNDKIRIDNFGLFSDMYKLKGYPPNLIEKRCAKLVAIIGTIAIKLNLDIRFDADVNYLLGMEHKQLLQRGIYLEALFESLDNIPDADIFKENFIQKTGDNLTISGMLFHLETIGSQHKIILDLNKMVTKKNLIQRTARFIAFFKDEKEKLEPIFFREIIKIASVLVSDKADDFKDMNCNNIQKMMVAV